LSAIGILTALLALAYFGSVLVRGRTLRGFGLPSGTEFLILGIVSGPKVLGVISGDALKSFEPVTMMALAWTALGFGLDFGNASERRIGARRLALGALCGLGALVAVGGAVAIALSLATSLGKRDVLIVSLGIGCVGSGTTRHAVRWIAERYRASGPLLDVVTDLAESDDLVPLFVLGLVFALGDAPTGVAIHWPWWLSLGSTLAIGATLGATCSALTDAESRSTEKWGLLLGAALVGIGAAMRLGQSPLTVMFLMGITLSILSHGRADLRAMLALTERPVMMPGLVLAGASVVYPTIPHFWWILGAALAGRIVAKLLVGTSVRAYEMRAASRGLGLALMPAGILTITIGLSCAMRFPGVVGETILAVAACTAVVGELVGPAFLRRELANAGELSEAVSETPIEAAAIAAAAFERKSFIPTRPRSRIASHPSRPSLSGAAPARDESKP
jgi:hypothetical protein